MRFIRPAAAFSASALAASVAFVASVAPSTAVADGELEAGVTVGGHVFSSNSELGVSDLMDGASPQSSVMVGGRLGYAFLPQLIAELEIVLIPTVDDDQSRGAVVYGARGHVRYQPFGDTLLQGKLHPFLLAGYGVMAVRTDSEQLRNDADQSYDWGLGTHYTLNRKMELRFDARHVLLPDRSKNGATSNFEISAGLTWHFGRSGGPGRGSLTVAEAAAAPAPAPVASSADRTTATVAVTAGASARAPAAEPAVRPAPTPTPTPTMTNLDADGDGVPLPQDLCPRELEDRDGFQDGDGCPEPDNDGDSIGDSIDRCAKDPETLNGYADGDGCPDAQHPDLATVSFARGSASFTAESAALLDKTFQTLQANPSFRIDLGGHSSSDESNRGLSLQRAEAIRDYLIRRGIAAARLRVLGFRSEMPVTADKSNAGRAKNRRVELRLIPLAAPAAAAPAAAAPAAPAAAPAAPAPAAKK